MKSFVRAVAVASVTLLAACGEDKGTIGVEQPLTYEQYKALAYQEPDTGVFISNGDELVQDEGELRQLYNRYAEQFSDLRTTSGELIVNRVGGRDDRWSDAIASNITYCVSQSSFGSRYSAVVNAMNSATSAWEGAARVNFVHASAQDGNCTRNNSGVVFNVRQVSTSQYLARAFFPSSSRRNREVLISTSSFGNISPWTLAGVLRHELGHTIGFRHEHTRPESGTCFEDNNWRALTSYDSASVMHYPQCNGTNRGDLVLTSKDTSGARALYP